MKRPHFQALARLCLCCRRRRYCCILVANAEPRERVNKFILNNQATAEFFQATQFHHTGPLVARFSNWLTSKGARCFVRTSYIINERDDHDDDVCLYRRREQREKDQGQSEPCGLLLYLVILRPSGSTKEMLEGCQIICGRLPVAMD